MGDPALLFRLVAACVLIGLLAYCSAHVLQVWRRRNARFGSSAYPKTSFRKIAWVCLILGLLLIPAAWVLRELTRSEGVLSSEELYVVRARDDLSVEWLHQGDTTDANQPLVRFGSRPSAAKFSELQARLARAESERDVLRLSPLTPDPELTRRHQVVTQERAQIEQELGQTSTAADSASRDLTAQLQSKKETLARLERTLTERRKELERGRIRAAHYQELSKTYSALLERGTVTMVEYREHEKSLREATAEVTAITQELKDGQLEKDLLQEHVARLEAAKGDPKSTLPMQIGIARARLSELKAQENKLKAAVELDKDRSVKHRDAELSQAEAKIRECQAGIEAMSGGQEARAPFSGRVAYRAPSPNAVRPGGALLVVGPENGFLLTARMPRSEAVSLQDGSVVSLEVAADTPERRIPARLRRTQELVHEPGQAAIQLECQPPPEVVRRLAEGEKLTVAFSWSPALFDLWPFRLGLLLTGVGIIGLALPLIKRPMNSSTSLTLWQGPRYRSVSGMESEVSHLAPVEDSLICALTDTVTVESPNAEASIETSAAHVLADELDELCRQVVQRVNQAQSPDQATWLLDQLHRIRSTHRGVIQEFGASHDEGERINAGADA